MRPSGNGGAAVKDAVDARRLSRLVPQRPGARRSDARGFLSAFAVGVCVLVGLLTPAQSLGQVIEFPLASNRLPYKLTSGPDGAIWFSEADRIGRITTSGVVTDHAVGMVNSPHGIATGPDGALWIAES